MAGDHRRGTLRPVINATGRNHPHEPGPRAVKRAARQAMVAVAAGYYNLEYDLEAGERGPRYLHTEQLLCRLTGAEAALVVNNNAGAVFLVLTALARGKGDHLTRPTRGDRRRLSHPRCAAPERRTTGGGRHHQPHASAATSRRYQPRDSAAAAGARIQLQTDRLHRRSVPGGYGGAGAQRRTARRGRFGQRHASGYTRVTGCPPSRRCRTAWPPAPTW